MQPEARPAACAEDLGRIEPMSRGARNWLITIPADGSVAMDGVAPALIEWDAMTLGQITPILRCSDEAKTREFSLDFLGFTITFASAA